MDDRILLIDDDDELREAVALFLEGEGYDVVEARDGADALEQLRTAGPFCLILLDLFMPRMDGWAFREAQRQDPDASAVPVIVVSADNAAPETAADLGAVGVLVKPISFDGLLSHVARHC
jgi:two-component system, chemotaxis family, chemotaxis protein CheY